VLFIIQSFVHEYVARSCVNCSSSSYRCGGLWLCTCEVSVMVAEVVAKGNKLCGSNIKYFQYDLCSEAQVGPKKK
jgi:hypothetical protein